MLSATDNDYMSRVGTGTPMGNYLRRYWHPFLESSQLPEPEGNVLNVTLLGERLIVFRDSAGKVGLMQWNCPHRSAPLYYARNEESGLRCVYHGWKFDVTGQCVDMPSEPAASNFKDKVRARAYPVEEQGGVLWTYLGPAQLKPPLPQLEWALVPESRRVMAHFTLHCNWVQTLEGDVDSSHVGFLHRTNMRSGAYDARYVEHDNAPKWIVEQTDYGMALAAKRAGSGAGAPPCASQPALPPAAKITMAAAIRIQPGIAGRASLAPRLARMVTISLSAAGTGSSRTPS